MGEERTVPPVWAVERAKALRDGGYARGDRTLTITFARYIAEHEQPPADPLLVEARKLVADSSAIVDRASVLNGRADDSVGVRMALSALRRGIEIAKENPHV